MLRAAVGLSLAVLVAGPLSSVPAGGTSRDDQEKARRPKVTLRASPMISFSPSRVNFTAEIVGGPDDLEDYYCPSLEWDWGDGTQSAASSDCDPYEAGKSEIKRRYTATHTFQFAGRFNVSLRLKRNNKVLVMMNTTVQVRPGPRDMMGDR
jgi:hypothetical protein